MLQLNISLFFPVHIYFWLGPNLVLIFRQRAAEVLEF